MLEAEPAGSGLAMGSWLDNRDGDTDSTATLVNQTGPTVVSLRVPMVAQRYIQD